MKTRNSNKIALKYIMNGLIDNISALVQIMAWCRTGDKPLYDPVMTQFLDYASPGLSELNNILLLKRMTRT